MKKFHAELEYAYLLDECGLINYTDCTEEENKKYKNMLENGEELPESVCRKIDETGSETDEFQYSDSDALSYEEKILYLHMKKLKQLKTIKYCLIYLSVMLTVAMFALIYC